MSSSTLRLETNTQSEHFGGGYEWNQVIIVPLKLMSSATYYNLLLGHSGWVTCAALTPGCDRLVTGGKDCNIMLWDLANGQLIRSLIQDSEVTCCIMYPLLTGLRHAFVKNCLNS